jgi:HYR domain
VTSKTKGAHVKAILAVILLSFSLIGSSHSEKVLASSTSPASNANQSGTTNSSGSTNTTNATAGSDSENATADLFEPAITVPQDIVVQASSTEGVRVTYIIRVQDNVDGNAALEENGINVTQDNVGGDITISCNKASGSMFLIGNTEVECRATDAARNEGNASFTVTVNSPPPLPTTAVNASTINSTQIIEGIFDSNLPIVFITIIFLIIIIPLGLDMWLAYHRKPTGGSTDKENGRALGMPGLYRSLMTFGIIVLVGTVIFYLLALITLNINNPTSPILQSLIDILKNLGTILGTALATIIAFYFGMRGTESATEKAAAATEKAATAAAAATEKAATAATTAAASTADKTAASTADKTAASTADKTAATTADKTAATTADKTAASSTKPDKPTTAAPPDDEDEDDD